MEPSLIAGVIFVAAEVALLGAAVLERLRTLEKRLKEAGPAAGEPQTLERIGGAALAPRWPFPWLGDGENLSVFVPVLMGSGIALSALAWLVERLALATARPIVDRRLPARLTPLSLPSQAPAGHDLLDGWQRRGAIAQSSSRSNRLYRRSTRGRKRDQAVGPGRSRGGWSCGKCLFTRRAGLRIL